MNTYLKMVLPGHILRDQIYQSKISPQAAQKLELYLRRYTAQYFEIEEGSDKSCTCFFAFWFMFKDKIELISIYFKEALNN